MLQKEDLRSSLPARDADQDVHHSSAFWELLLFACCSGTCVLTGSASAHSHSCTCIQRWPPGSSTSAKGDETYQAPLSSTVYIEQTDFREDGQVKDFYGLTPGREVLLRCDLRAWCCLLRREGCWGGAVLLGRLTQESDAAPSSTAHAPCGGRERC